MRASLENVFILCLVSATHRITSRPTFLNVFISDTCAVKRGHESMTYLPLKLSSIKGAWLLEMDRDMTHKCDCSKFTSFQYLDTAK